MSEHINGLAGVNDALCSFSDRWQHDGDYLRCKACKRPQLTSYMDHPFPHVDRCKSEVQGYEKHPWRAYLAIIARMNSVLESPDAR